jgi:hypothetical protein
MLPNVYLTEKEARRIAEVLRGAAFVVRDSGDAAADLELRRLGFIIEAQQGGANLVTVDNIARTIK